MPEGHTIHRRARDHTRWFAGHTLRASSPQGRFDADPFDQRELRAVRALGKHLIYDFGDDLVHVHLGLFGRFRVHRAPPPPPRPTVRMRLEGNGRALDLTGPTACERWAPSDLEALRSRLGPDPLDPDAEPARFASALSRRRIPIAAALLDQSVIAGIGNVYRAELLLRARLDPFTPSREVEPQQVQALWDDAVRLLQLGVKHDRIFGVDASEVDKPLPKLRKRERINVYKRGDCRVCGGDVGSFEVGGRTLYACPTCQQVELPGET